MSKVAIIFPSNRPHLIERQYATREHLEPLDYQFHIIAQDPVSNNQLLSMWRTKFTKVAVPEKPDLIEMVRWYDHGFRIAQSADYFLIVDDDHRYVPGSGKYFQECIDYMDANPNVGFMYTKGYTERASEFGDSFWINPEDGMISLGRGMILRNIKGFHFTEKELGFVGTLVESLICYKIIMMGYDVVKRFHNPTLKDPSTKLYSGGIAYSRGILLDNILGHIKREYLDPSWEHESREYPTAIKWIKEKKEKR